MDEKQTVDSKFRFVLVAAHRAEQLMRGARPKIEPGKRKPTRVAMDEVNRSLVDWGYGPPPQEEGEPAAQTEEQVAAPEVH
jgi:DNA-directed RNA polymerase omega subunit